MEADSFKIAKVFSNGGDIQFRLPYFQREYAWNQIHWQTIWNDILDLYDLFNNETSPEHFLGSLVVVDEGTIRGTIPAFKLVDGQQRLTTITLVLCALADLIKESEPGLFNRIRKYIVNPDEQGDVYFKLLPTTKFNDRKTYTTILSRKTVEQVNGSQILPAYNFFCEEMSQRLKNKEIEADKLFLVIINCLQVVFIKINNNERPYQIFESLNAKGKPLTQADLVRNYIAMKLPEDRQPEIFENHWAVVENLLQEKRPVGRSKLGELTAFLRHYLAFRNGVLGNEEHVYARFRDRIETEFNSSNLFEKEIIAIKRFADFYNRLLRPEYEPDLDIKCQLERLNILEIATGYPLLLALYDAYSQAIITRDQFLEALRIIENYMIRRYIAGEQSNYLNKSFPTLWKEINLNNFIPSLKKSLLPRNCPSDYRIRQVGVNKRLYDNSLSTRSKTILVLETVNRYLSDKKNAGAYTVLSDTPTIEHIMPQTLDEQWKSDLGENYEEVYDQYLNTLGNLTLVTSDWNSSLSNSRFSIKKEKLASHGLLLNNEYFSKEINRWDDQTIKERAEFLLDMILELWPVLGDVPTSKKTSGKKPVKLIILGQDIPVVTWRDVAIQTTEIIIKLVDDFGDIASTLPANLSLEPFRISSRELSNGWYINVNLNAASMKDYCRKIITRAGFSYQDWFVVEE